nr:DUF222 domain-containing protein [Arthrobacter sp. ISL-72]
MELDRRTHAQRRLDGLVNGCKAALASGKLPAAGGLRPQVMATIDYRELLNRLDHAAEGQSGPGTFTFTGPVTASTIRKIACDADIIPVLLGSEGRVLDIGPPPGSSRRTSAKPSPPATRAAPSPPAPSPPPGAKPTTSPTGHTAAPRAPRTAPCSAPITTTSSTKNSGPSKSKPASRGSSRRRPTSTRAKNHNETVPSDAEQH